MSPLCGVALFEVGIALRAILGESRQLGWHAVPTLPDAVEMGDRGAGSWRGGVGAELSNRQTLTAIRYLMYLIDSALSTPYSVLRAAGPRAILLDNVKRICTVFFVLSKPSPQAQPSKSQDRKAA